MVFDGFDGMMLILHDSYVCVSLLRIIHCLCCAVHIMLMVKCLIDIFLCFCGLHGLQCT